MDKQIRARLRDALDAEQDARDKCHALNHKLDQARDMLRHARQQRAEMVVAAAVGAEVKDILRLDRTIAEADATITAYEEAMRLAERRITDASCAVTEVLAVLAGDAERQAQAEYDEACRAYEAAAVTRNATWQVLQQAQRLRDADGDVLRTRFSAELQAANAGATAKAA